MANKKAIRTLDRKSMKNTKGGIIAVLKPAAGVTAQTEPAGADLVCRKAGGEQQSF